jgi:hypothetical protein
MSYLEFCNTYWTLGYHWPYPVPRFTDPTPNTSYRAFESLLLRTGKKLSEYDRGLNLIRACYDYLAGAELARVELAHVLQFLGQPWEEVVSQLTSYQPVYPWLLAAHMLLEGDYADVFRVDRIEGAIESATYTLKDCLIVAPPYC